MARKKYRPDLAHHLAELRQKAEAKLQGAPKTTSKLAPELGRLVHELEVHRFELEIQNEELRAARIETEAGLARYTALFDFAPIGYATLREDATIREINHAGARLLGRERGLIVGKTLDLYVPARDLWTWESLLQSAFGSGHPKNAQIDLWRVDMLFAARLTACLIEQTERVVLLAIEDMTESHSRERQLASAEPPLGLSLQAQADQQRQMDDSLPVLVWGCDPSGACNYLSRRWTEYTGVAESAQHGSCWLDQAHPEDRERARAAWHSAVSAIAPFDTELRLRCATGEHRWFRLRSTPIRDPQGTVLKWYGTASDIEDLEQTNSRRQDRTQSLSVLIEAL